MELNLKEMKLALQALNEMDTDIVTDPLVDKAMWKIEWAKKDAVSELGNKLFSKIKELEEKEFKNSDDPFAKIWNELT